MMLVPLSFLHGVHSRRESTDVDKTVSFFFSWRPNMLFDLLLNLAMNTQRPFYLATSRASVYVDLIP